MVFLEEEPITRRLEEITPANVQVVEVKPDPASPIVEKQIAPDPLVSRPRTAADSGDLVGP